ncbi:hypothetical protein F0562_012504 [Nyssa sinensis]|uniref:Myb/SANT-like domain-containing protein n=1 Tax=Nyssa sinensis TaxID=561372 RepID=A0A5J4ZSV7_9ASTE|nr:hypothetical protein F0562_012504 [Nyssa sinensis]
MSKKVKMNDTSKRDRFIWTALMDDTLIDAFYQQNVIGNKIDGTFTTKAYDEVVKELCEKLGMDVNKDKIKNRLKTIKTHFNECFDLFNYGLSGFSWSPITKLWSAEPEVWKSLIEAKSKAEKWRTTLINHYDKLCEMFAKDRATGAGAETAKEKRRRWVSSTSEDPLESIHNIDQLVSQNEVTLENFICDLDDDVENITSPKAPSTVPSQSATSKKKNKKMRYDDEKDVQMVKAIESVAEAIKEGNAIYEKYHQPVYLEKEVYNELIAIGVQEFLLDDAYLYLTSHPDKMRQFLGCPFERRKGILERMMQS